MPTETYEIDDRVPYPTRNQKVICIVDMSSELVARMSCGIPKKGEVYTIFDIKEEPDGAAVTLHEVDSKYRFCRCGKCLFYFMHTAFRPLRHSGMKVLDEVRKNAPVDTKETENV